MGKEATSCASSRIAQSHTNWAELLIFLHTFLLYVLTFHSLGHVFYVFVGYNILVLLIVHIINCCSAGEKYAARMCCISEFVIDTLVYLRNP